MNAAVIRPLVTDTDNARLRGLLATPLARHHADVTPLLLDKLSRARIIPAARVPASIVTMNSRLACWDDESGVEHALSLVYPWNAAPAFGRISILSRLGVDLLGGVPGQTVRLGGARVKIAFVLYQPEAERQFFL